MTDEDRPDDLLCKMWDMSQENARHFNDILMRIRGFAILLTGAFFSGFFAVEDRLAGGFAGVIGAGLSFIWFMFYFLDRFYYHVLLQATIDYAQEIEERLFGPDQLPRLSKFVRQRNRQMKLGWVTSGAEKVALFYGVPMVLGIGYATLRLYDFILTNHTMLSGRIATIIAGGIAAFVSVAVVIAMVAVEKAAKRQSESWEDPKRHATDLD